MLWYGVILYAVLAYAVCATLFTPVIALIVNPELRDQAGGSKLVFNIICIVTGNAALVLVFVLKVASDTFMIPVVVCTIVGEVILWFILTGIVKNEVVTQFNNLFCAFYVKFKSKAKTYLLQPFFWINLMAPEDFEIGGILKIFLVPVLFLVGLLFRGPMLIPVDTAVMKENCAIVIVDTAVSINFIASTETAYTNNGKKWEFEKKGDGLYVPEGEYLFSCDFSKTEKEGKGKVKYAMSDLEVFENLVKGKTYHLKYNLEKVENNQFRVSLFIDEG